MWISKCRPAAQVPSSDFPQIFLSCIAASYALCAVAEVTSLQRIAASCSAASVALRHLRSQVQFAGHNSLLCAICKSPVLLIDRHDRFPLPHGLHEHDLELVNGNGLSRHPQARTSPFCSEWNLNSAFVFFVVELSQGKSVDVIRKSVAPQHSSGPEAGKTRCVSSVVPL